MRARLGSSVQPIAGPVAESNFGIVVPAPPQAGGLSSRNYNPQGIRYGTRRGKSQGNRLPISVFRYGIILYNIRNTGMTLIRRDDSPDGG